MSLIKKSVSLGLVPLVSVILPVGVHAQVTMPMITPSIIANPGQYQVDNTAEIVKVLAKLQGDQYALDREYIDQTLKGIKASYASLLELTKQLGQQQIKSADGTVLEFSEVASLKLNFEQTKASLQANLESLANIPSAKKDAQKPEAAYEVIMNFGRLDLSPIVKPYLDGVKNVESELNSITVVTRYKNGVIKTLTFEQLLKQAPQLGSAEVTAMSREAQVKRIFTPDEAKEITNLNTFTRTNILSLIETFGDGNHYRAMSEGNRQDLATLLTNLEEAFWLRSVTRTIMGANIGVIGIQYDPKVFNLDRILTKNHIQWFSGYDYSQAKLTQILSNYTNLIETQTTSAQDIFGRDVTMLSRLNSTITRLQGQKNLVEVNLLILKLLAADIKEELIVMNGGAPAMKAQYIKRYFKDDATQKELVEKRKFLFGPSNISSDKTTLQGIAKGLDTGLLGWKSRIAEANAIEAEIKASQSSQPGSDVFKNNEEGI